MRLPVEAGNEGGCRFDHGLYGKRPATHSVSDDELAAFVGPARHRLVHAMKLTGICDLSRAEAVLDGYFEG
jgi:hypothetical protein